MRVISDNPRQLSPDRVIAGLAARQHGVVTLDQLRAAGVARHEIDYRLGSGRLHRIRRKVYAPSPVVGSLGRTLAAVLTVGADAFAVLRLAAELWGLEPPMARVYEVGCPRRVRSRDGIRVHRVPLAEHERAVIDGVPVTSVARTLADLANTEKPRVAERAVERAEVLRLLDLNDIALLEPRRSRRLRALVAISDPGTTVTRARAEEAFLAAVRAAGLPDPLMNAPFVLPDGSPVVIDAYWPREGLAVEIDDRTHMTPQAFARDRHRDRQLTLAGIRPVRLPAGEAGAAAAEVAALLASPAGRRSR